MEASFIVLFPKFGDDLLAGGDGVLTVVYAWNP